MKKNRSLLANAESINQPDVLSRGDRAHIKALLASMAEPIKIHYYIGAIRRH